MEEYCVKFKQAKKLNKLGFNEISYFGSQASLYNKEGKHVFYMNYGFMYSGTSDGYITAPLYHQIINWLEKTHKIYLNTNSEPYAGTVTHTLTFKDNSKVWCDSKSFKNLDDAIDAALKILSKK